MGNKEPCGERENDWNEAKPAVFAALDKIAEHVTWAKLTYGKGPEHRAQFLADVADFGMYAAAAREALPAPDDGEAP